MNQINDISMHTMDTLLDTEEFDEFTLVVAPKNNNNQKSPQTCQPNRLSSAMASSIRNYQTPKQKLMNDLDFNSTNNNINQKRQSKVGTDVKGDLPVKAIRFEYNS